METNRKPSRILADAWHYLLGEYHGASAKGDNSLALDLYDAMLIIHRADESLGLCY
jgi:hypothetical protein